MGSRKRVIKPEAGQTTYRIYLFSQYCGLKAEDYYRSGDRCYIKLGYRLCFFVNNHSKNYYTVYYIGAGKKKRFSKDSPWHYPAEDKDGEVVRLKKASFIAHYRRKFGV